MYVRWMGVAYLLEAEIQYYPQTLGCLCWTPVIHWNHVSLGPLQEKYAQKECYTVKYYNSLGPVNT